MKEGWKMTTIGEACNVVMGQSPPSSTYNTEGVGVPFFQGKAEFTEKHPVVKKWCTEPKRLAKKGDILMSVRAPVGDTNIADQDCSIGRGLAAISTDQSDEYIYYLLKYVKHELEKKGTGTTFKAISGKTLRNQEIPLPPLPEQRAIVAKLELLLGELDRSVGELEAARGKLGVYRQSVLKEAFDSESNDMILGDMVEKVQIGPFGSQLHKSDYVDGGVPVINPTHIRDGFIVPKDSFSIKEEKKMSLPNYILQEGDVIMGRRGEMGRCALVDEAKSGFFCGTGSLYVRPVKDLIASRYLWLYLGSARSKSYLQANAKGTTMKNLNKKIVKNIPVPLPSLPEQQQIVSEIESRFSVADALEKEIDAALARVQGLRMGVLKKAFGGELV